MRASRSILALLVAIGACGCKNDPLPYYSAPSVRNTVVPENGNDDMRRTLGVSNVDLSSPIDMANDSADTTPDMAAPAVDMAIEIEVDAAAPLDFSVQSDLTDVVDLTTLPDLKIVGDLSGSVLRFVLSYGQSLSNGYFGENALTITPDRGGRVLMFKGGVNYPLPIGTLVKDLTSFVPAVEDGVETGWVYAGQQIAAASGDTYVVSAAGVGASKYDLLRAGTGPYAALLGQVTAARVLAEKNGQRLVVPAIMVVHGETDEYNPYAGYLQSWSLDFNRDIQQTTGQAEPVVMLHSQSAYVGGPGKPDLSNCHMLTAAEFNPGKIVLVGPKYQLPHQPDGTHLLNTSYRWMGAYYAKAYNVQVVQGQNWWPTMPVQISRSGAVVSVKYHVPVGGLVFDTVNVTDPKAGNGPSSWGAGFESRGFEFVDNGDFGTTITKVAIVGQARDTVEITLSQPPKGNALRLRYAYSGGNARGGPTTGPRGCLRDEDPATSPEGPLWNWGVTFDKPVP